MRQRISQVLVLPPFQKSGHGERLLASCYRLALADGRVKDVTVEDPSDQFQTLRDFVDCRNALETGVMDGTATGTGTGNGYSDGGTGSDKDKATSTGDQHRRIATRLQARLKVSAAQAARVVEILALRRVDRRDAIGAMKYRQTVIRRLTDAFGVRETPFIG